MSCCLSSDAPFLRQCGDGWHWISRFQVAAADSLAQLGSNAHIDARIVSFLTRHVLNPRRPPPAVITHRRSCIDSCRRIVD